MFLLLRIIYHILWSWFKRKWKGVNAVSTKQQNSYCLNIYCCHWSQEFPSVVSHRGCCLYDMDPTRSTQWAQFFVSLTYVVFGAILDYSTPFLQPIKICTVSLIALRDITNWINRMIFFIEGNSQSFPHLNDFSC